MTRFSALDISNFYIQLVNSLPGDSIDNLKLNKLLYFAQGWSLARYGKPLFSDDIEAWEYGPVIPSVYHTYKKYKDVPISAPLGKFDEAQLTSDEVGLLADVYSNYGQYTGVALMNRTHLPGTPWRQAYEKEKNHITPEESMMEYFKKHHTDFKPFDTFQLDKHRLPGTRRRMRCMIDVHKWEIWEADVPFEDEPASKRRPVLIDEKRHVLSFLVR